MIGAGLMQNVHFVVPGEAQLELILNGDLVWLDLHESAVQLHYIAEKVFEEIYDIGVGGWLITGYEYSTQAGTATVGLVNRITGEKRAISPDVSQFIVLADRPGRTAASSLTQPPSARSTWSTWCAAATRRRRTGSGRRRSRRPTFSERAVRRGAGAGPGARHARGVRRSSPRGMPAPPMRRSRRQRRGATESPNPTDAGADAASLTGERPIARRHPSPFRRSLSRPWSRWRGASSRRGRASRSWARRSSSTRPSSVRPTRTGTSS